MTLDFWLHVCLLFFLSGFISEVGSLSSFSAGPSNRRQRRIILTTDVAESSVTIPDVDLVIDCCTHKRPRWNPTLGFSDMGWTVNGMHCEERCLAIRTGRARSLCSAAFFVAIWEAYFSYDSSAVAAGEGTQSVQELCKELVDSTKFGSLRYLAMLFCVGDVWGFSICQSATSHCPGIPSRVFLPRWPSARMKPSNEPGAPGVAVPGRWCGS